MAAILYIFRPKPSSVVSRLFVIDRKCLQSSSSVKYGRDKNAETKNENRRSNFVFQYHSYENEKRKWLLEFCYPKVAGKQKTKTDGSNSIFNVVGKRKAKTESQVPFSDDVGKGKTKLEVQIPFPYFAGKRLALRYTHYFNPKNLIRHFQLFSLILKRWFISPFHAPFASDVNMSLSITYTLCLLLLSGPGHHYQMMNIACV